MFLLKNFGLFTNIYKVTRLPQRVRGIRTAPRTTWHQNATNDKRPYSQRTRLSYPCKTWKGCSLVGVWNVATFSCLLLTNFLLQFHFAAIDASWVHQQFAEISPASHNQKKNTLKHYCGSTIGGRFVCPNMFYCGYVATWEPNIGL